MPVIPRLVMTRNGRETSMRSSIVIGLRKDHDELEEKHNNNTERIGRVEESTKTAHRRIYTLEQKVK